MSLPNDLKSADLEQRSKELDARANALEVAFSSGDRVNVMNVLNKHIDFKEQTLETLDTKIKNKGDELTVYSTSIDKKIAALDDKYLAKKDTLDKLEEVKAKLDEKIAELKIQVITIQEEIQERTTYFSQQEEMVSSATLEWNDRLHGLKFEAEQAEKDKERYLADIVRLDQEKVADAVEIEELDQRVIQLNEAYEEKAGRYRESLSELKAEINQKQNKLDEFHTEYMSKVQDLELREKSLTAREMASAKESNNLDMAKRKFESDKAVQGYSF